MKLMTGAPSGDASLAHEGPSTEATRQRVSTVQRRGPKSRVSELLRLVHRLALAILTLSVCAVITSPGRSPSLFATAVDEAAPDSVNAGRVVLASEPLQYCEVGGAERVIELKAVELDRDNEDDDPPGHVPGNVTLAFRHVPVPPRPDRALRGELQIDPSRFAAGTGLPRGPPA